MYSFYYLLTYSYLKLLLISRIILTNNYGILSNIWFPLGFFFFFFLLCIKETWREARPEVWSKTRAWTGDTSQQLTSFWLFWQCCPQACWALWENKELYTDEDEKSGNIHVEVLKKIISQSFLSFCFITSSFLVRG